MSYLIFIGKLGFNLSYLIAWYLLIGWVGMLLSVLAGAVLGYVMIRRHMNRYQRLTNH